MPFLWFCDTDGSDISNATPKKAVLQVTDYIFNKLFI